MSTIRLKRTYRILVPIVAGQSEYSLNNQDFLNDKIIKNIFLSGQTTGMNNETPILNMTNQFYLRLFRLNRILVELPSSMLQLNAPQANNYSQQNVLEYNNLNEQVDWQMSRIIFPTNVATNTNLELIVCYED